MKSKIIENLWQAMSCKHPRTVYTAHALKTHEALVTANSLALRL